MKRQKAERIANGLKDAARKVAGPEGPNVRTTRVHLGPVAAALGMMREELEMDLANNMHTVWGCLPMGWTMTRPEDGSLYVGAR